VMNDLFEIVLSDVSDAIRPKGFSRRGKVFWKVVDSNIELIAFQKSVSNTSDKLLFTINLGISCGELMEGSLEIKKRLAIMNAHFRQRIGFVLEYKRDHWWEISAASNVDSISREICHSVCDSAIPYLDNFSHTRDLIALWETGSAPGLTAAQRDRFLSVLKTGAGERGWSF